jgi:hypothetical protein
MTAIAGHHIRGTTHDSSIVWLFRRRHDPGATVRMIHQLPSAVRPVASERG